MSINFDDVKSLIKNAIGKCSSLGQCRVTDAYPPTHSDSPVKRNICAIGLLSAERSSRSGLGVIRVTSNTITAFADIYTPVSQGGKYSSDCALELCSALGQLNGRFSIKASVGECAFLSNCCAYRTRVKISVSQSADGIYNGDIDSVFTLYFNELPYMCRSVSFKLCDLNTPIECYGEAYPTAFTANSNRCVVKVKRYISDDGKSLKDLKYPFTIIEMISDGFNLADCAVIDYEVDRNMLESVTISGRNNEDGI